MPRSNLIALLLLSVPCLAAAARGPTTLHVGQLVNRPVVLAPEGRYAMSFHVDFEGVGGLPVAKGTQLRLIDIDSGRDLAVATLNSINVFHAALTPDGRFALLRGNDYSPPPPPAPQRPDPHRVTEHWTVWDLRSGAEPVEICRIAGAFRIADIAISADGSKLLSVEDLRVRGGKGDGIALRLRDARTGEVIRSANNPAEVGLTAHVAMTPDARIAITGGGEADETVRLWDLANMRPLHVLRGHTEPLVALALTDDGRYAASADKRAVRVWDVAAGGAALRTLAVPSGQIEAMALSPDGRWVLTAHELEQYIPQKNASANVRLWEVESARMQVLTNRALRRGGLAFQEDAGGATTTMKAVIAPGSTIEKIDLPPPAWKTNDRSAATLPAVATTVAVAARTPLVLRRLPGDPSTQPVEPVTQPIVGTPRMIQFIHHPQRSKWRVKVGAVAWNPLDGAEGRALAAVQDDRDTYLYSWDVVTGEQAGRVHLGGEGVSPMPRAISRDATRVFCFSHGADGMGADVWDAAMGARIARHTGPVDSLGALALSRNGFVVAVGGATYEQKGAWAVMSADIGVWDARSGGDITKLPGDGREVSAIAFSPDGTRLVSGSDEPDVPDHIAAPAPAQRKIPGVRLWDIKTARETAHFVGPLNVRGLAFTSDGKRIVLCGDGQGGWDNIWVLDGQTLAPIASTKVVHSQLTALAISPDGTRLLTGGSDSNVRIWELATLREIHRFEEHAARITCVAFSPHGRRAVSGDEAGGLGIWELPAPADR